MAQRALADQYTRPLVDSDERRSFTLYLARALASTDDPAEKIAVGQEVAETARRRNHELVRALEMVATRREEKIAVGQAGGGVKCCPPGVNTQPQCTIDGRRICDYDRVGHRTLTTAGNAIFTLTPEPSAGNSYWRPKMVRTFAHNTANPSVPAWEGLFITTITVGTHPVEGFNNAAAATIQDGIHFGDYVVPDTDAVPVGWPVFSNESNSRQLVISGIGLWPAASAFIAYVTVLGNAMDGVNGNECRTHPWAPPLTGVPGASTPSAGNWTPA